MEYDLGTAVHTRDGRRIGTIDRLILSGADGMVQSLVVHKGRFLARDVLVPLVRVARVAADGVYLDLGEQELEGLPSFREEEYAYPPEGWQPPTTYTMGGVMFPLEVEPGVAPMIVAEQKNLAPGSTDIARDFSVVCTDGEAGSVRDVAVDADSGIVAYLVLRSADEALDGLHLPLTLIDGIDGETVTLRCTLAELPGAALRQDLS